MSKHKTYMRRVFGGAEKEWNGIDQGKGPLYRGRGVEMALNATFDNNVFAIRDGAEYVYFLGDGVIHNGIISKNEVVLCFGTNVAAGLYDDEIISVSLGDNVNNNLLDNAGNVLFGWDIK